MPNTLLHVLVMMGITALIMLIFRKKRGKIFWLVILSTPWITELIQIPIPDRSFELKDIFFDYLGITLAYCVVKLWEEIAPVVRRKRKKPKLNSVKEVIDEYHKELKKGDSYGER